MHLVPMFCPREEDLATFSQEIHKLSLKHCEIFKKGEFKHVRLFRYLRILLLEKFLRMQKLLEIREVAKKLWKALPFPPLPALWPPYVYVFQPDWQINNDFFYSKRPIMACTQILHILQTDFEGKNSCKEILYLAKNAVPTLKKISLLAYDSGKNPTARPLYVRKKKFYHQRVWGKTFFPRQITHTTHSPSMSNGRLFLLFLLFLCCSGPLFRSLPNVPLFLCSSCFVPC